MRKTVGLRRLVITVVLLGVFVVGGRFWIVNTSGIGVRGLPLLSNGLVK